MSSLREIPVKFPAYHRIFSFLRPAMPLEVLVRSNFDQITIHLHPAGAQQFVHQSDDTAALSSVYWVFGTLLAS